MNQDNRTLSSLQCNLQELITLSHPFSPCTTTLWNSLNFDTSEIGSIEIFKLKLQTHMHHRSMHAHNVMSLSLFSAVGHRLILAVQLFSVDPCCCINHNHSKHYTIMLAVIMIYAWFYIKILHVLVCLSVCV